MTVVCEACGAFTAEVQTPVGDGARETCWMCAHLITEHDVLFETVLNAYDERRCACPRHEVFPSDVIARRQALLEAAEERMREEMLPKPPEPAESGYTFGRQTPERPFLHANKATRERARGIAISRGMRAARAMRLESNRAGKNPVRD